MASSRSSSWFPLRWSLRSHLRARRLALPGDVLLAVTLLTAGCHDFSQVKFGAEGPSVGGTGAPPGAGGGGGAGDRGGAGGMAPVVLPPSCSGATPPMCGTPTESCCAPAEVVPAIAGFSRGFDMSPERDVQGTAMVWGWQARNAALANVDAFALDKYEVTVGRFRAFYAQYNALLGTVPMDKAGQHPAVPGSGWSGAWTNANNALPGSLYATTQTDLRAALDTCVGAGNTTWLDTPSEANDPRPMPCVTWYEAFLFCIWDHGRLPTETEWNVAAAGGAQYRAYPWDAADFGAVAIGPTNAFVAAEFPPRPVGSFPDGVGRWGHMDLAGNAYEYVRDRADTATPTTYVDAAGASNPIQLTGPYLIVRGGSFVFPAVNARTSYRYTVPDSGPTTSNLPIRFRDVGWRCARNP